MLQRILSSIICDTFERQVGRWQGKNKTRKAMKIRFRLSVDFDTEDGYRWLDLIIYGPHNYVYVFTQESWNLYHLEDVESYTGDQSIVFKPGKGYEMGKTALKLHSFHDSCWRDAVNRIIKDYENRLKGLDSIGPWFEVIEVMQDMEKEFSDIERSRRG